MHVTSVRFVGIHRGFDAPTFLRGTSRKDAQPIQSLIWGRGVSDGKLFTTSGPADNDMPSSGFHRIFDISRSRKHLASFGSGETAGECLDITHSGITRKFFHVASVLTPPTGDRLAHVTCDDQLSFELSFYDPRLALVKRISSVTLPALPILDTPRVQQVLFSPDSAGVLVAVARSDNKTHVYDSRFLGKNVLYEFPHIPAIEGTEEDRKYGVYKVEWVQDPVHGLGLVSFGADGTLHFLMFLQRFTRPSKGCVRLWDIKRGDSDYADNVIGQSTSYAGWFSLGDTSKGEKTLVM